MYNGNGNYNGGTKFESDRSTINVGGFRIKPVYLYAGIAVLALLALYFVTRFLNTGLVMHFGAFAGVLLLVANLRELIGQSYAQRSSTALLNVLIGGALICAWLTQITGVLLLWIPAVVLLGIATPLTFGRASIYSSYVQTARGAFDGIRRSISR
jgi:hypothetical protein